MKSKDRKRVVEFLEDKKDQFINILPPELQTDFRKESYIAGGSIYSVYRNEQVNDIDFFIETADLKMRLLTYFKNLNNLKVKWYGGKATRIGTYKGYKLIITDNAISIGDYQIVMKDYGKPEEVVGKFDFKHNMNYVKDGKFVSIEDEFYLDLDEIRFNDERARDIVSTIMRTLKFQRKGWKVPPKELAKMLVKLTEVGFNDEELELLNGKLHINSFGSGE